MSFMVLVVDDEEAIGREIVEAIGLIGGSAVFYTCADSCLEYVERSGHHFEVIIADLAMPAMNGLEFLNRIRKVLKPTPKCFLMTGLPEFQGSQIFDNQHFQVLPKPISLQDIKEKLGRSKPQSERE